MPNTDCYLLLGGGGMIGTEIARQICQKFQPRQVVICSLFQKESRDAVEAIQRDKGRTELIVEWGNVFVRDDLAHARRDEVSGRSKARRMIYEDIFGPADAAYERSYLVSLLRKYRPDVIVDSINTATAISYQDVFTASRTVAGDIFGTDLPDEKLTEDIERLLISQYTPQLVRHVMLLHRAMCAVKTRMYVKIGTTGTGGMGLNIPYTHGEDRPSATLMSKTAMAFAHSGLLFLADRTPGGPIIKEIKPGAMVGYSKITVSTIKTRDNRPVTRYRTQKHELGATLTMSLDENSFEKYDTLQLPVVDTGENGEFAKGEFEAITSFGQMEFVTPEEIAHEVVTELRGGNSGLDVISAINSAVMDPSYKAGYIRDIALHQVRELERDKDIPSIAIGRLGPPELSKLLWEAELLRRCYETVDGVLEQPSPFDISDRLEEYLAEHADLRDYITAIGLPIVAANGAHLWRGPRIKLPEVRTMELTPETFDLWADRGWVDLRPRNMEHWLHRFQTIKRNRYQSRAGSGLVDRTLYMHNTIRIGEIVAWIFANEHDGYRGR